MSHECPVQVHPSSDIEAGAVVGEGTRVWHRTHVRDGAVVGRDCSLGNNVFVDAGAVVGDRCKIQNNVSVYSGVTLEDEVFVGPSAVFTNDRHPRAHSPNGWNLVSTIVRHGASIGANATIVCGVVLGRWCTVGAGSVVVRSTEPYELVVGNPARRVGWTCMCGAIVSRSDAFPEGVNCPECGHVLTSEST